MPMIMEHNGLLVSDPLLPRLSDALDEATVLRAFRREMAFGVLDEEITHCTLTSARYKPGRSCLLTYDLRCSGVGQTMTVVARVYPTGLAQTRYHKAAYSPEVEVYHVASLDMVAWVYPFERKIKGLSIFSTKEPLTKLAHEAAQRAETPLEITSPLEVQSAHYVPEQSKTVLIRCSGLTSQGPSSMTLYAKKYLDESGQRTYGVMEQLKRQEQEKNFVTAKPLLYDKEHHILFQQGLDVFEHASWLQVDEIAPALNDFAKTSIKGIHTIQTQDLRSELEESAKMVVYLFPNMLADILNLTQAISERLDSLSDAGICTLHGDLHPGNLLRSVSGKLGFIDLDGLRMGPRVLDIASFVAFRINKDMDNPNRVHFIIDQGVQLALQCSKGMRRDRVRRAVLLGIAYALVTERIKRCITRLRLKNSSGLQTLLEYSQNCLEAFKS